MLWNILYLLDILAILLFAISYYRNCYSRGYRIDFWHAQLFLMCVLPNLILLPFARSESNVLVLREDFGPVVTVLPTIFLLALLGYVSVIVGGEFWRIRVGLGIRKAAIRLLDVAPHCSMTLMSSQKILVFQSLLCCTLQALVLGLYFAQSGFGFNLRSYTFAHPALRPVVLVVSNYSIIIASHCIARYIDSKERPLLVYTLFLTVGLIFFGARSNILAIYINILLCYLVKLRTRISILRLAILISIILLFGLYLGALRSGDYSLADFFDTLAILLFYGNNFSDLRDFAWVYAKWDHVFWVGKTYLAAIFSFVPRFASGFRDAWGLGAATAITAGFDPQVHPGLRPGAFGEGYFNFGCFGVILVGLAIGIITRRVDIEVKCALSAPRPSVMKAFSSTILLSFTGAIAISANFSGLYVLLGVYLFSWICLQVQRMVRPYRPSLADAG